MVMRSKSLAALAAVVLTGAGLVVAQDREVRKAERAADKAAAAQDRAEDRAEETRDNAPPPATRPAAPAREAAPREEVPARQAAPAQDQAAEPADRRPMQTYRAKQVIGARLSIQGNISIGTVDDIVFADDGYIEYLVVQNEGKMVTVPWEAAKFDFEKRSATVNITQEQFRQVPTYTQAQFPTYSAPTYRTEIYRAYGLTGAQERRLERRLGR